MLFIIRNDNEELLNIILKLLEEIINVNYIGRELKITNINKVEGYNFVVKYDEDERPILLFIPILRYLLNNITKFSKIVYNKI